MPRLSASQVAVKILDAESATGVDSDTGEGLDTDVIEEVPTALVPIESTELVPTVERAPTELEFLLQFGSYQIPLNAEERRLYLIAQSGVYRSVRTLGQAVALVGVAKALGITEHAAFAGIYLLQGGMSMSAHLIGALVRRSGVYDYKVAEMTPQRCEIVWFKDGAEIGRSDFTLAQAQANGWVTSKRPVWLTAPDEQCRNRALAKGARTYCGEVFAGAGVYTPEELTDVALDNVGAR